MKRDPSTPSATSLPRAPHDDANRRMTKYFIMMAVRVACFIAMVVIAPYGWHTAALAVGAIVLPYLAMIVANVGSGDAEAAAESPRTALTVAPEKPQQPPQADRPTVIEIRENRPE